MSSTNRNLIKSLEKSAERNSQGNTYLTYKASGEESEAKNNNASVNIANIKSASAGEIREISDGIVVPIQNFPEEINVTRNIERDDEEKNKNLNISKVGPLELEMELKYTSITQDNQGNDKFTNLPSRASRLLQRLTMPIRPPRSLSEENPIPRIIEIRIPVVTVKYEREIETSSTKLDSRKEVKEAQKKIKKRREQREERKREQLKEDANQAGPVTWGDAYSAVSNYFNRAEMQAVTGVEDKKKYMTIQKFSGWISGYEEERRNFDKNQRHNELIASLTVQEVLPDKLKSIASTLKKAKVGNSGAVGERVVGNRKFTHDTGVEGDTN